MTNWCIYYEDGKTFCFSEGCPWDAPRVGVEAIITEEPDGRFVMLSQADYYYFEPERVDAGWWHADQFGVFDHLQRAARPLVLFGRNIKDKHFSEIEKRALEDLAALNKRAWLRGGPSATSGKVTHG